MIQYNGLTLAYIGDAYYELAIREYLLHKGLTKVNQLHDNAIQFTSAVAQAQIATVMMDGYFTEFEQSIFKRGRNANATHKPKNADVGTYNAATGFEAVVGYLYLDGQHDRLNEMLAKAEKIIEEL